MAMSDCILCLLRMVWRVATLSVYIYIYIGILVHREFASTEVNMDPVANVHR